MIGGSARAIVMAFALATVSAIAGQQSPKYGSASPEGDHGKPTARNQSKKDQG